MITKANISLGAIARDEYSKLKKELATKYPYDSAGYCDGKEKFVKAIELNSIALINHEQKV